MPAISRKCRIWFYLKTSRSSNRFVSTRWIERSTREAGRGQEAVGLGFRSEPPKAACKVGFGKPKGRDVRGHQPRGSGKEAPGEKVGDDRQQGCVALRPRNPCTRAAPYR